MALPIALGIIAAGAGAKYIAERGAAKRRESIRRSMDAYQRARAHETELAAEQLIAKQTPQQREAELTDITADRTKSMKDTVGAAQAFEAPGIAGKLSADYRAAEEAEAASIAERTRRAIEQLAVMGAPTEQQQRFGIRFGRSAGTVDAANRASANVGRAYASDIDNVRPNPVLAMLGDVGMSVGGGMAGHALMSGGGGPTITEATGESGGVLGATPGGAGSRAARLNRGFSLLAKA